MILCRSVHYLLMLTTTFRTGAALNVTGYMDLLGKSVAIFTQPLTWFEAQKQCREDGYLMMDFAIRNFKRTNAVAQTLREVNYPANSTFWVGVFRPYQNEDKWLYAYRSPCKQMPSRRIKSTVPCDHQCFTLTFVDNEGQKVEGTANCAQKLPYTCAADPDYTVFEMYKNYTFTSIPSTAQISVTSNGSFNDCQGYCGNSCAGFSYSFTNKNCSVINLNEGHGHLIYTIEPVKDFVWHGVRNGTNVPFYDNSASLPPTNVVNEFPVCDITTAPPGYCPCQTSTKNAPHLESQFQLLIQNLTIDKETTAKSVRRYKSAYETRPFATTSGVLGVVLLTSSFGLVLICDIGFQRHQKQKRKKKTMKKKEETQEL